MTTTTEKVKLSDIHELENNPRWISKDEFERLKKSIKDFPEMMEVREIVVDETGAILGGNQRYKALLANGETEATVKRVTGWTDEMKREFVIKDNHANGEWDTEILANNYDPEDLKEWMGDEFPNDWAEEEKEIVEDEVPEPPEEPKAKLGDIYQLGEHRLMCGDATKSDDVEKLMDGKKADMVFTDPPYNMDYCGAGFINDTNSNVKNRIKDIIDFDASKVAYLSKLDIGSVYIFTSKDLIKDYMDIFSGWKFNLLIWEKTNTPPMVNNNFFSDIEYCLYFHKGKRIWNNGLRPIDKYKKFYISSMSQGKKDGGGDLHPTMKPVKFLSDKIEISSNIGGIVLDIFGGSGSTLIACEQLNRKCYMMELDPHYVDVIIQRWENFTGEKAVKL